MTYRAEDIIQTIESFYPCSLAESWDNPGLLAGHRGQVIRTVVIALDASRRVVNLAVREKADMILTHHPMIFDGIKAVTDDGFTGRKLLALIENRICCYAMHTNFDIARCGMAYIAAERLGLKDFCPLELTGEQDGSPVGIGFVGDVTSSMIKPGSSSLTARDLALLCRERFGLQSAFYYDSGRPIRRIAVCPGSGRHMMDAVKASGADAFVTGDTGHHDGMDYFDEGITLVDAGHFGVEHIFTEHMKHFLGDHFPDLKLIEEVTDERQYV